MPSVMFSVIQGRVPGPPTPAGHRAAGRRRRPGRARRRSSRPGGRAARVASTLPRSTVRGPSGRGASSSRCIRSTAPVSEPSASARAPISGTLPAPMSRRPAPTRACSFTCAGIRSAPTVAVADSATGASSACSGASPGASAASRAGTTGARCACTSALPPPAGSVARGGGVQPLLAQRQRQLGVGLRAALRRRGPGRARPALARQVAPSWRSIHRQRGVADAHPAKLRPARASRRCCRSRPAAPVRCSSAASSAWPPAVTPYRPLPAPPPRRRRGRDRR